MVIKFNIKDMKNSLYIIATLCAVICFTQCTKVNEGGWPKNSDSYMALKDSMLYMELTVGEQTKTTIGASDYSVQWNAGDSIFVVAPDGGCLGSLKTEQSGSSAKFTGMIIPWDGAQNIQFYYLGSGSLALRALTYDYNVKSQNGTLSDLASNLQIMHGQIENVKAGNGNLGNLTMKSLISIVKIDLLTKSDFSQAASAYCLAPAKVTITLADASFSKALRDTMTLATPSTDYYMAVIPQSQNFTFFQSGAEDIELIATSPLAANGFYTGSDNSSVFLEELDKGGYTENGWGYGEGVEINDLIWAPVNCGVGYKKEYKYGKLYQWGRIDGTGYNTGTAPYNVETTQTAVATTYVDGYNKTPDPASFYKVTGNGYDWYTNASAKQLTSWPMNPSEAPEGSSGIGNPCPDGWRVPTEAELTLLMKNRSKWTAKSGRNGYYFSGSVAYSLEAKQVFLPAAGDRANGGGFENRTSQGRYWTASVNGANGRALYFTSTSSSTAINNYYKAYGLSVRCVKDVPHSGPYAVFSNITFNSAITNPSVNDYKTGEFVDFNLTSGSAYEIANIPLKNLTVGQWYSITFSESIAKVSGIGTFYENAGSLSNSVRPDAVTGTDYTNMVPNSVYNNLTDWFVWAKDPGVFGSDNYVPTSSATTIFKATAETMYWVWDFSKLKDACSYNCRISLTGAGIKPLTFTTGAKADLCAATLYGWYRGTGDTSNGKKGMTTYKVWVENQSLEMFTTGCGNAYGSSGHEKINIPLTGLTEGKDYKLTFDYNRQHITSGTELSSDDYDLCCGISKIEFTSSSTKDFRGTSTDDYFFKENNLAQSYSDSLTFTASGSTMYWVWSMDKFIDYESFVQTLSNVKLTEVTE